MRTPPKLSVVGSTITLRIDGSSMTSFQSSYADMLDSLTRDDQAKLVFAATKLSTAAMGVAAARFPKSGDAALDFHNAQLLLWVNGVTFQQFVELADKVENLGRR